jgi:hypothetical protein
MAVCWDKDSACNEHSDMFTGDICGCSGRTLFKERKT